MDADKIVRAYMKTHKTLKGIKTFNDAQLYAEAVGKNATDALGEYDFTNVSESELSMVLRMLMRQAHYDASAAAKLAQRLQNQQAGLGVGVLDAVYNPEAVDKIAADLVGKEVTKAFVSNLLQQQTVGAVDDTIKRNAEAHDEMGLRVHIVRKYSDVGLRDGTPYAEPCQWCMERCGEWDNYRDAFEDGCFERHPGCLCTIDYQTSKIHAKARGWSGRAGWMQV